MEELPYDVIVVGAGHAGIEAALAAARMGRRTLLLTMNLDSIGLMPCNPSIGGPAKGHLVREIDALGGEMGRAIDDTFIHIRTLNTGKGPAVQAFRAQADKAAYRLRMKRALERQPGLDLKQAMVDGLLVEPIDGHHSSLITHHSRVRGVVTDLGRRYYGETVVLTTGTSLRGRVIVGDVAYTSGRSGEAAATTLSGGLEALGFELGRLKTGTPPRIHARSIDFTKTEMLAGSSEPLHFSFWSPVEVDRQPFPAPNPVYPSPEPTAWRPQMACYLVHTNEETHRTIRSNLDRAPLFTGLIEGVGPRYCPSIEDKIVRFAHKEQHQFFLEPEGWETAEVYVQGANTSLPEDVQVDMLRTIPALRKAELIRVGYAIEYDYVPPRQITAWLEAKLVAGLFLAGQVNGTSGYEEAAGQGLVAGINASLVAAGRPPLLLERSRSYLGVMIDDLVTREIVEPYRLLTSRAEHRLLLRQDNADERLTLLGHELGLIDDARYQRTWEKYERVRQEMERLSATWLVPSTEFNSTMVSLGQEPLSRPMTAASLMRRPEMSYSVLAELLNGAPTGRRGDGETGSVTLSGAKGLSGGGQPGPDDTGEMLRSAQHDSVASTQSSALSTQYLDVGEQVEVRIRYAPYIQKQQAQAERTLKLDSLQIPADIDYSGVMGLRNEAREQLARYRPATIGMASRINGVTSADVAVLLIWVEKRRRSAENGMHPALPPAIAKPRHSSSRAEGSADKPARNRNR
jgi:tRNA uridine 5-carboxymethylaminomethyl modification enzyme